MKTFLHFIVFSLFTIISSHAFAQQIAAGGRHSLAICADSTVQAWGYNGYGQLGNGNITEQHSGTQVIGLDGIVQVAGGLFHSLFVKSDGSVWSCGRNPLGNLGDGTNQDKSIPVQVLGLVNIIQAAGGGEHSLFLKSDSTVWACGNNASGQLGDGTNTNRNIPVQINGLSGIIQVAAGAEFSLFLKVDGSVWACGHNGFGQYGNGTNTSSKVPVQISGLTDIVQLSAGEWHSLFTRSDGTVFSSGRNQFGQLGDGTIVNNLTATQIPTLSDIIQVEAGGIHSVFLQRDGTVWSCGLNSGGNNDGQLGDGTTTDRHTPVQVISSWGVGEIVRAEATREHSLFLKSDGSIWGAGRNNYGQLGYGVMSSPNSVTPVLSGAVCNVITTTLKEVSVQVEGIHLFPNPSSGMIYVKSDKPMVHLEIFDARGEKCFPRLILNHQNYIELDLTNFREGMYILQILDDNNQVTSKKFLLH